MKLKLKRAAAAALSAAMAFGCFSLPTVAEETSANSIALYAADAISIQESGGWFESAYVKWAPMDGADGYAVFVKVASAPETDYVKIDNELIREYPDFWRADVVGLKKGSYMLKVVPYVGDNLAESAAAETGTLEVKAYDRSGAAFSEKSDYYGKGSGAYNDDGTLKSNAKVFYVTRDTAKTITTDMIVTSKGGTEKRTGIQDIIQAKEKGCDPTPLDFRIVGTVSIGDLDSYLSKEEGLQLKGKNAYSEMNITIEGIGEDAVVNGFGFLLNKCGNVEFRNFAVMNFLDDGVSIDTDNTNLWIHNLDLFYGSAGSASDQAKGDGSVDIKKRSKFTTFSYNHFWDSGKSSMCGMKEDYGLYDIHITYHHNWFDHSDSRHPRIRSMSVHMYNNYYDGNSKYGVGVTSGASSFVQNNYFNNCKHPMLSSLQGSDVMTSVNGTPKLCADGDGTFSKESGGSIKAYGNIIVGSDKDDFNGGFEPIYYDESSTGELGKANHFDAYLASSPDEKVPSTVKVLRSGSYASTYNNFDTDSSFDLHVNDLTPTEDVPAVVTANAGRMNGGDFPADRSKYTILNDSTSYSIDSALKSDVVNYKSTLVSVGGNGTISTGGTTPVPMPGDDDDTEETTSGSSSGDNPTQETTSGSSSGDNPTPTPGGDDPVPVSGAYVHNFTTDGLGSDSFFTIEGDKKDVDSKTWNGLTLTQALKLNSKGKIAFNAATAGKLTVVSNGTGGIKIGNLTPAYDSNGVVTVDLAAGSYVITKKSETAIYYVSFEPEGGVTPTPTPGESTTAKEEITQTTTEAEYKQETTVEDKDVKSSDAVATNEKTVDGVKTVETIEINHSTDAEGDDVWELVDNDDKLVKYTIPIEEISGGVAIVKARLTPSVAAGSWAMMQVWGKDSDGDAAEVLAFTSNADKKKYLSARTNQNKANCISTGVAMAATSYDVTLIIDIDNGVGTVSIPGGTATISGIDVSSIDSVVFVTAESASRNLKVEKFSVGVSQVVLSADSFEDVLKLVRNLMKFEVTDKISAADYDNNGIVTATDAAYLFKKVKTNG